MMNAHSQHSRTREKTLEYLFLGELLKQLWQKGSHDIEILRADVDNAGYDLVLESGGVIRHIEFKATMSGGTNRRVDISLRLAEKPSGCVIWMIFDPSEITLGPFYWFGNEPGIPLPPMGDTISIHSKGNASGEKLPRPGKRRLNRGVFERLNTMEDVAEKLFG